MIVEIHDFNFSEVDHFNLRISPKELKNNVIEFKERSWSKFAVGGALIGGVGGLLVGSIMGPFMSSIFPKEYWFIIELKIAFKTREKIKFEYLIRGIVYNKDTERNFLNIANFTINELDKVLSFLKTNFQEVPIYFS